MDVMPAVLWLEHHSILLVFTVFLLIVLTTYWPGRKSGIERNAHNIDLMFPHPTHRALVGELLHNDGIAGFEQYLVKEFDAVIGPRGD